MCFKKHISTLTIISVSRHLKSLEKQYFLQSGSNSEDCVCQTQICGQEASESCMMQLTSRNFWKFLQTPSITTMGWLSSCQVLYKQIAKTVLALGISLFFVKPEVMIYFGPLSKRVMKAWFRDGKCFSFLSLSVGEVWERKTCCRGDERTRHYYLSKGSGGIRIPTRYLWVWSVRNEWL